MKNKAGIVFTSLGLLLIVAAFLLGAYNVYESHKAGQNAKTAADSLAEMISSAGGSLHEGEIEIPDYVLNPEMEMPVLIVEGQEYIGILEIPVLGLKLPVISQWSYKKLKIAPCRYIGSVYTDDLVIAAHNYKTHFGKLTDLNIGERILFTDVDGHVFSYKIMETEILKKTDVEEMEAGLWDLTLFTCTVGGSYRVTVRCESVS